MFEEVITRHERIAMQFSGGKDSLAVLFLLRPYWNRMTVYYLNSGDAYPEVSELVKTVKEVVPNFVEVAGRQPEVTQSIGWPTDLVPHTATAMGIFAVGRGQQLTDRYSCCFQSVMLPMHERMLADRVTLIIRGQRMADAVKSAVSSGQIIDGVEFLYPIEDWSDEQVFDYLSIQNAPVLPFYAEGLTSSPDCMHCTAWLEHKGFSYLQKRHPDQAAVVGARLRLIRDAVRPLMAALETLKGL